MMIDVKLIMIFASAPVQFSSDSNVELILRSAAVVVGIAFLGFIPIRLARVRRGRHSETIMAVIVLWGLLSAVSVSYAIMQQFNAAAAQQLDIQNGYYNPSDSSNKPTLPIGLWCGLGVCYVIVILWASRRPRGESV